MAVIEIGPASADQVVEHVDPPGAGGEQMVHNGGPDGSGSAGDQDRGPLQCAHRASLQLKFVSCYDAGSPVRAEAVADRLQHRQYAEAGGAAGPRGPLLPDAAGEFGHHLAEGLVFGQCRGPGVTQPVGNGRCLSVRRGPGLRVQADPAVVDAEPLLGIQIVPDQGAPGAADHQLPDLGGAQPVHVDVGHGVVGQRERQVADAGVAGSQGIRAVGRHFDRPSGRREG